VRSSRSGAGLSPYATVQKPIVTPTVAPELDGAAVKLGPREIFASWMNQ
jgi:hypothetical protein